MRRRRRLLVSRWTCRLIVLLASLQPWTTQADAALTQDREVYRAAHIKLQNALQEDLNNRELRRQLGLLHLEWGNYPAAEKELRRAIELGVPKERLYLALAETLAMQGKAQELLVEMFPGLLLASQDQAAVYAYRGDAWLRLKRLDRAMAEYATALQASPDLPQAKLGLARLALQDNKLDEAKRLATEALVSVPKSPKAWSVRGQVFETAKQLDEAEQSYSKAIALQHFSPLEHASRALIRINTNRIKEAWNDFEALEDQAPDFFLTFYVKGLLYLHGRKYEEAQSALQGAQNLNDQFTSINYFLGIAHLYQNHIEEADKYLSLFLSDHPGMIDVKQFLALAKLRKKDYEAARELLDSVLAKEPNNPFALKLMGDLEFAQGHREKGVEYRQRAVALSKPEDAKKAALGAELLRVQDRQKVLGALKNSSEIDANLAQNLTAIVFEHLHAKQFEAALAVINQIKKKAPGNSLGDHLLGTSYRVQNNPAKALAAFNAALAKAPGNPAIVHELAQMALRERNIGKARQLYEQALTANPKDLPTQVRLAELDVMEGNFKTMEQRLTDAIADHPKALEPRMMLAAYYLNKGQPERGQPLLQDVQVNYLSNAGLLTLLAHIQLVNRQSAQAFVTIQFLIKAHPQSAMAHYLLARVYSERRDKPNMNKALEKAIALDRKFLPARYMKVKLLASENQMEAANAELQSLLEEFGESPETLELKAWFATARNKPKEAVAAYQTLWEKDHSTASAINIARAKWRAGEQEAALDILEQWLAWHPEDTPAHLALAEFYAARSNFEESIRRLESVLRYQPDNILAMNNLAWLFRSRSPDKAYTLAQRAVALAPQAHNALDTLALIELDRGEATQAITLLKRALELAPTDKPIQYHLALALDKAGRRADAIHSLNAVLADANFFPEQKDAKQMLNRLSGD